MAVDGSPRFVGCAILRTGAMMGTKTKIEWTESSWNPTRGCSVVSPGCENCYAMHVAARFSDKGQPYEGLAKFSSVKRLPQWTGKVRIVPEHLGDPLRWTRPRRVFVNSMSDLFHEGLSNDEIAAVFGVMAAATQHTFQVLTKRAKRMREWFEWMTRGAQGCVSNAVRQLGVNNGTSDSLEAGEQRPWPLPNVWLGVSAENQECADERIPELLRTPAAVRFVSYEPALGPVDFANWMRKRAVSQIDTIPPIQVFAPRIDWLIVGGESGPRARRFHLEWARSVVKQCADANVDCFVKQLGADPHVMPPHCRGWVPVKLKSRKGNDMTEWPADLRVRQFPKLDASAA